MGDPAADIEKVEDEKEEGEITPMKDASSIAPAEGLKKHPLEHHWTLWFDNPDKRNKPKASWGDSLKPVYTFGTVEDFWCVHNNIVPPSRLPVGADFHCFKKNVEPKWEDPKCAQGGKWTAAIPMGKKALLDQNWLNTLLGMIGEQFEDGDEICGAVVQIRGKQDRIAIWTRSADNEGTQLAIARQWKGMIDTNEKLAFMVHDDAKRLDRKAKDRYTY